MDSLLRVEVQFSFCNTVIFQNSAYTSSETNSIEANSIAIEGQRISNATAAPAKSAQTTWKPYPNFKVIVLNDDFNTFEHVAGCLLKHIPHMNPDKAWKLTNQIHFDGQAIVWIGPQEQAELYHTQLSWEGLTMAPLESA